MMQTCEFVLLPSSAAPLSPAWLAFLLLAAAFLAAPAWPLLQLAALAEASTDAPVTSSQLQGGISESVRTDRAPTGYSSVCQIESYLSET